MIYDRATDTIVGNLGWVDHGSLWLYSVASGNEQRIAVEGAAYLDLRAGLNGLFRLTHHQSSGVAVSIRQYGNPVLELASLRFVGAEAVFAGDIALWWHVDPAVIVQTNKGPRLVRIDASQASVIDLDLSWFTESNYDVGYQGLVDCISLPDVGLVVVAVQRSSELILIDTQRNQRVGAITLARRGGNPMLIRRSGSEFAASDYDCLCIVDAAARAVRTSKPLQKPSPPLTQQFIGEYDLGDATCAVARPYSGDVLLLDIETFAVRDSASVGAQPLAICMTSQSEFVTRDWKTGEVRVGHFSV